MKKFLMSTLRILAVIGGALAFKPLYEWFEGNRSSAFNDWIMMDNSMGYNKPWDFGSTGSILGTLFIIGLILLIVFGATATDKDEKKGGNLDGKLDTVRSIPLSSVFFNQNFKSDFIFFL